MTTTRARVVAVIGIVWWTCVPALAQRGAGELRVRVVDEAGLEAQADGTIEAAALDLRRAFTTDERGRYVADNLPFGVYRLHVTRSGFAPFAGSIEVAASFRSPTR